MSVRVVVNIVEVHPPLSGVCMCACVFVARCPYAVLAVKFPGCGMTDSPALGPKLSPLRVALSAAKRV